MDDEPCLIHYLGREFSRCGRGQRPERESARKRAPLTNSDAAILSLVAAAAAALSLRLVDDDDKEKRGERGEREGETLYVVRGASRVAGEGRKEGEDGDGDGLHGQRRMVAMAVRLVGSRADCSWSPLLLLD